MPGQSRHTNRPGPVAIHAFDTKFAAHALRLGIQGVELLMLGRMKLDDVLTDIAEYERHIACGGTTRRGKWRALRRRVSWTMADRVPFDLDHDEPRD